MSMSEAFLRIEGLQKTHGAPNARPTPVLAGIDLAVARGQIACVLGPSGCGKSTLLRLVAGLESADAGAVFVDGREVRGPGLDRGLVFQDHALFPWLSVLDNVRFAVRARWPRWSRERVRAHCLRYLGLVDLLPVLDRRPAELSGGMRQRVGVARALSIEPKVLLLDEPFGALDPRTRAGLQDELLDLCATLTQTVLVVTHDVDEAILLGDMILFMRGAPVGARAEIIPVGLARARRAATLHREVGYAALRHRLLDILLEHPAVYGSAPESGSARGVAASGVDAPNQETSHDKIGRNGTYHRGQAPKGPQLQGLGGEGGTQ